MEPEQATLYELTQAILRNAEGLPQAEEARQVVADWSRQAQPTHDPFKTLHFMQLAYSFSTIPQVQNLLGNPPGVATVKALAEFLRTITDRQLIQEWSGNPVEDVRARMYAWTAFLEGLKSLRDNPKLGLYLDSALAHDKGYGQTLEAASQYFYFEADAPVAEERDFGTILAAALNHDSNLNIWGAGQANSGPIGEQLRRSTSTKAQEKLSNAHQEGFMWTSVVSAILSAKNPYEKEWAYAATIRENSQAVFDAVRRIVPGEFPLSIEALGSVLDSYGV